MGPIQSFKLGTLLGGAGSISGGWGGQAQGATIPYQKWVGGPRPSGQGWVSQVGGQKGLPVCHATLEYTTWSGCFGGEKGGECLCQGGTMFLQ